MVFATEQCYKNDVCYRGVLSKWYLLPGSVIRMMFATGECYQNWCSLPGSVIRMMFATRECYQNGICYRAVLQE